MFDSVKKYALSLANETADRQWGKSIILRADTNDKGVTYYREKFLVFNPGASIVLESHSNYDEIWIPDSEMTYLLEVDNTIMGKQIAKRHERVFIPRGKKHKISNLNNHILYIFEIQTGIINSSDKQQYSDDYTIL